MTNTPPDGEENDLTDDIFGVDDYEPAKPSKRDFHAWHKPRKQYVREHQWGREIGRVLDEGEQSEQALSYLGLPGPDLLDLRYLYGKLCAPRGLGLRFLGFNRAAVEGNPELPDLLLSLDELKRADGVDPRSDVLGDDVAHIGNESSIAWKRTSALGPFDIINWDLCDGFAKAAPSSVDDDQYRAINRLMSLQARSKRPWLLFLTTRIDRAAVNVTVLERLAGAYVQNLSQCQEFAAKSTQEFQVSTEAEVTAALESDRGLVHVFVTGLCKWLASMALQQAPPTDAHVESVIVYKVDQAAACEDLVSIAIRFTPTLLLTGDAAGLVVGAEQGPDECKTASRALMAVARRKNVDATLQADSALLVELVEATIDLLNEARYDESAYRAWWPSV